MALKQMNIFSMFRSEYIIFKANFEGPIGVSCNYMFHFTTAGKFQIQPSPKGISGDENWNWFLGHREQPL